MPIDFLIEQGIYYKMPQSTDMVGDKWSKEWTYHIRGYKDIMQHTTVTHIGRS
jgi:hypothetical protein